MFSMSLKKDAGPNSVEFFQGRRVDIFNYDVEDEVEVLEAFEPCVDEMVCSNRVEVVNIGPKRVEELGGVGGRYWGDRASLAKGIIIQWHIIQALQPYATTG